MGDKFQVTDLGLISREFSKTKLIDLCIDKSGVQTGPFGSLLHKKDYVEVGTPIITVEHLGDNVIEIDSETPKVSDSDRERLKKFQLIEGDIVFSRVGSVDRRAYISSNENGWLFSGRCLRVRVDQNKINPKYLSYYFGFEGFKKYIRGIAVGATMPSINTKILSEIEVYYPSYNQQTSIAKYLSTIDHKIQVCRKVNNTLEQMAQALFKSWFVDFDPVIDNALAAGIEIPDALQHRVEIRKKAHALQIQNPNIQLLPAATQRLFPSEFEHCGDNNLGIQGWIPKGWRVSSTDAELGIKGGSTPSTKNPDFWDGGDIHWTSPKDLSGNDSKILLHTSRKITEAGLAKITSGLLPIDTVLMSSRAPVGYLALAKVPLAINQGYIALECEKDLTPEFTIQFLDSIMDEIKGISGGTTFAEISKKTFRSIKLIVPSKREIDAYTSIVKANYDKITQNIRQTNSLTKTRDYLLPKLISGELLLKE